MRCTAYSAIVSSAGRTSRANRRRAGNSTPTTRSHGTVLYGPQWLRIVTPPASARSRGRVSTRMNPARITPSTPVATWSFQLKCAPALACGMTIATTMNTANTKAADPIAMRVIRTGRAVITMSFTAGTRGCR